jgi:hypothetical protein
MIQVGTETEHDVRTGITTHTPILRDLAEVKAEVLASLRSSMWEYIEEHVDTREREALAALMQKATLMRAYGQPLDEWSMLALMTTLQWSEDALASWPSLASQVEQATTYEEMAAVVFDPSSLGAPPKVSASEIALALRGGA